MTPREAYDKVRTDLKDALRESKMRVRELGEQVESGSVVVGPPSFVWQGQCTPDEPTGMTFSVWLVETLGDRAIERLLDNLPALTVALQDGPDALVSDAVPTSYPADTSDLPAYQLTAEMTL